MKTAFIVLVCVFSFSIVLADDEGHEQPVMTDELAVLLAQVRAATADFHELSVAEVTGYQSFLTCFVNRDIGGMGQHYVNGGLAGDDVLDPLQPEALVYEPTDDGGAHFVALEYLVFADVWDPRNEGRAAPTLFGQSFHLKTTIPDTPPVWALHVWLWAHNPEGIFADYNPLIFCPAGQLITDMTP